MDSAHKTTLPEPNAILDRYGLFLLDQNLNVLYLSPTTAALLNCPAKPAPNTTLHQLVPELNINAIQASIAEKPDHPYKHQENINLASSTANPAYCVSLYAPQDRNGAYTIIGCIHEASSSEQINLYHDLLQEAKLLALNNISLNNHIQHSNRQILQSEKMAGIGQLAAGVAHEINNPLGFVFSNIKTLTNYIDSLFKIIEVASQDQNNLELQQVLARFEYDYIKNDLSELLSESEDGLQRVKKIITSLKDFSHIDEEEFAAADLHKCIETTLSVAQNEIKYKANIIREFGQLPPIDCIASQINQVIMNITVNAAHAIADFGTIHIRTGTRDDKAWIEIEDNGSGIPEDIVKRIFEPFYTTKPIGKGTGLGLSLSQTIIDRHNGTIEIDSRVGRGTKFTIWLPVQQ